MIKHHLRKENIMSSKNIRKMSTESLARKFERTFGWVPFNPWEDRQMMVAMLVAVVEFAEVTFEELACDFMNCIARVVDGFFAKPKSTGGKISEEVVRLIRNLRNVVGMI